MSFSSWIMTLAYSKYDLWGLGLKITLSAAIGHMLL